MAGAPVCRSECIRTRRASRSSEAVVACLPTQGHGSPRDFRAARNADAARHPGRAIKPARSDPLARKLLEAILFGRQENAVKDHQGRGTASRARKSVSQSPIRMNGQPQEAEGRGNPRLSPRSATCYAHTSGRCARGFICLFVVVVVTGSMPALAPAVLVRQRRFHPLATTLAAIRFTLRCFAATGRVGASRVRGRTHGGFPGNGGVEDDITNAAKRV